MIVKSDLVIGEGQPPEVVEDLVELMNKYRECVALSANELGKATGLEMDIVEKPGSRPVSSKPHRASSREREDIRKILQEWREAGIIRDTESPYASPVLLVRKKDGTPRLVVDFRRLNKQTERVHFPLPNLDDHLALIRDSRLFITLDLAHGYLQIPLTEKARPKTAIVTPDETAEFTRMIFGLMNGPAYFSKVMHKALGPLRDSVVLYYLDDIFIPGRDWVDLRDRLIKTLDAIQGAGLTLKLSKCRFLQTRVTYLGYEIGESGIEPGEAKVRAIAEFPVPKNATEVRRFLGMASFFRRFIPKFARLAAPLHGLLKNNIKFEWNTREQNAFQGIKDVLVKQPVLQPFDPNRETQLHTDASAEGLGALLLQKSDRGQWQLVYAVSRRTSDPERHYHSSKLELLAIVWAVTRLRPLLLNIPFTIITDCQALVHLSTTKTTNPQIVRWVSALTEFEFSIVHRPGEKLAHADALSRAPVGTERDENTTNYESTVYLLTSDFDEVLLQQCADTETREKKEILTKPESKRTTSEREKVRDYRLVNGLVYKCRENEELLFLVPRSMRKSLVVRYHECKSHPGVDRTCAMMAKDYYFPGMRRYTRKHIKACVQCAISKGQSGRQKGELHPIPAGDRPFALIHVDHTGPFVTSKSGNKYILVIVDNLTKYVVFQATRDTKTRSVIRALEKLVDNFGAPVRIVSDRGTCFTSKHFSDFRKRHGIRHTLNSPRHPQANGLVERMNSTLISALQTSLEDSQGKDWDLRLAKIQRDLNDAPNAATKRSPFELLYGYTARRNEGQLRAVIDVNDEYTPPQELQEEARERIQKNQQAMKRRYDAKRLKNFEFANGDLVFMRTAKENTGESTKLQRKFRGPLTIVEKLPGDTYRVTDVDSHQGRRYASTAHASQLRVWLPHRDDDEYSEGSTTDHGSDEDEPKSSGDSEISATEAATHPETDPEPRVVRQGRPQRVKRRPQRFDDFVTGSLLEDEQGVRMVE